MFDVPIDAWYLWVGLAAASVLVLGVAIALPTAPGPDAAGAADAVDTVAASAHDDSIERPLPADRVKLGPHRISLRDGDAAAHASFVYGPITPVAEDTLLWEVVRGASPAHVFDSARAFRRAAEAARDEPPAWRESDGTLRIRRMSWEGVDVTLVDA